MSATVTLELNDQDFEPTITGSDRPVLVDFWAEWCMPCRMIAPTIDNLASEYQGRVTVGKVNVDDARQTATRLGITAIPTLILFKDGQPVEKFVGVTHRDQIAAALDRFAA